MFSPDSNLGEDFYSAFPLLKTLKFVYCRCLEIPKEIFQLKNKIGKRNVKLFFHYIHLVTGKELDGYEDNWFKYNNCFKYNNMEFMDFGKKCLPALLDNYEELEDGLNFVTDLEFTERAAELFELNTRRFLAIFDNVGKMIS